MCVFMFRVRGVAVSLYIHYQCKWGVCVPEWMSTLSSLTFSRSWCVCVPRGQGLGVRTRFQFRVRLFGVAGVRVHPCL